MRDDAREKIAHLLRREMAIEEAVARDRNRRGLFRNDEDRRVGLLRQTERRAMPRAKRFVGNLELREREYAPRADDLVSANQDRAVMERRVRREDGGEQIGRDLCLHRHTRRDELLEPNVAFDG